MLSLPDAEFNMECQSLFYFAASRVMDCIITHYHKNRESLRQKLFTLEQQITMVCSQEDIDKLTNVVLKKVNKAKIQNISKHEKKIERDQKFCHNYIPWRECIKPKHKNHRFDKKKKSVRNRPSKKKRRKKKLKKVDRPTDVIT